MGVLVEDKRVQVFKLFSPRLVKIQMAAFHSLRSKATPE